MSGGGIFQKPDVGFGVGVKPTDSLIGSPSSYGYDIDIDQRGKVSKDLLKKWSNTNPPGASGYHPGVESGYQGGLRKGYIKDDGSVGGWGNWKSPTTDHPNYARMNEIPTMGDRVTGRYTAKDISEAQGRYDRAEERRQEKLDAMAELAQGQGDRVQAPRPPGQGQPGQFQVKSTPMVELKRRFPSLVQTEGSLNPFLGRRYNK